MSSTRERLEAVYGEFQRLVGYASLGASFTPEAWQTPLTNLSAILADTPEDVPRENRLHETFVDEPKTQLMKDYQKAIEVIGKQQAEIERLTKEEKDHNDMLTAAYMRGRQDGIMTPVPWTPPTMDELRASGEWFLVWYKQSDCPIAVKCRASFSNKDLPYENGMDVFAQLRPGDRFKRLCDPNWTEVGDE